MVLTMSSRTRVTGCSIIFLLVLSAQAINYEIYRYDVTPTKLRNDTALTSRDFLEQWNHVEPKASFTLQEGTEHLLHLGALLRARILDTFGNLLYIYYDDFSIAEVKALRKMYQEILQRRYDIFDLIPSVLKSQDTRPSRICAKIYAHVECCLRDRVNVCRRIRKQHGLPHFDNPDTPVLNITYSVYRLSKISKQYPKGFSLSALLKFLQREILAITPGLLSGLLHNVRYDSFDDDVRLAERELIRYFSKIAQTTEQSLTEILMPLSTRESKRFHSVTSLLKYYIDVHVDMLPDDLKRHALLIARRIVDDVGTIDENIHLLGNVYENGTIHMGYLFDLVLPDDVLDADVTEAKRYLIKKLDELDMVDRYLRVRKYQQATPAQLVIEITDQLRDIGFARDIATALRMHARFWHRSRMIESLDELLMLFDAYENLRQVPRYRDMMVNIDRIRESLWNMRGVSVEILCNVPRACLRTGLQTVLHCKYANPEIKKLITSFLNQMTSKGDLLSDECVTPVSEESRRAVDIPFKITKIRYSARTRKSAAETTTEIDEVMPTEEDDRSEVTTESSETYKVEEKSDEAVEELSTETESVGESTVFASTSTAATLRTTTEFMKEETTTEPILTTTMIDTSTRQEETTTIASSTTAATTTTTKLPATTTAKSTTTTTTTAPTTSTTLPVTTTVLPTTVTTSLATTTSSASTTSTTISPTTTTTASPTTPTTTSPTTVTSPATTVMTSLTTTETVPNINMEMGFKRTKFITSMPLLDDVDTKTTTTSGSSTTVTTAMTKSCESDECSSEQTSEGIKETTISTTRAPISTTTRTPTTQASTFFETTQLLRITSPESLSTQEDFTSEMTTTTTESIETPTTEEDCITEPSHPNKCTRSKSGSIETSDCAIPDYSGKSCSDAECDSFTDCDDEDSLYEDSIEKPDNRSIKCPRVRCEEESPEISSEYESKTGSSCKGSKCSSKNRRNLKCVKLCASQESSSCEEDQDDRIAIARPRFDLKFKRTRNRSICEIRDPHYRRQMRRLAKMRAISVATSRTDVINSRTPQYQDRIAIKKLYNLLAARLPRSRNKKSRKTAKYLPNRSLSTMNKIEGKDRKRRKRYQISRIRSSDVATKPTLGQRYDNQPSAGTGPALAND